MLRYIFFFFRPHLSTNSGFLQQVLFDLGALDGSSHVEMDVDVFPKARRVVVANGFSVAECWKGRKRKEFLTLSTCHQIYLTPLGSPTAWHTARFRLGLVWFLDFTFKDGVCLEHLLFNPGVLTTDGCQELQDQFGALSLSCSRFTASIEPPQNTKSRFVDLLLGMLCNYYTLLLENKQP